jgi:hypothetical protein
MLPNQPGTKMTLPQNGMKASAVEVVHISENSKS